MTKLQDFLFDLKNGKNITKQRPQNTEKTKSFSEADTLKGVVDQVLYQLMQLRLFNISNKNLTTTTNLR